MQLIKKPQNIPDQIQGTKSLKKIRNYKYIIILEKDFLKKKPLIPTSEKAGKNKYINI